ncbi:MAG TPA: P-II family nitrogen regulator [Candidatus Saccharimonadales bacterium]|nr:P-II family nitrogen regulator [Candidatus Saccharimonadales bacterium]
MKEIKAIIQPFMLDKVLEGLTEIEDLPGITVSEVRGFGCKLIIGR